MKGRIYLVLIGLLSVWLGAAAETDTRTEVTEVVASCTPDIASIVGYGKTTEEPTFAVSEGSVANIRNSDLLWQKKNSLSGDWEGYYWPLFLEGEYRARIDVRIDDEAGETHKLAGNWTLTVNGQQWTTGAPNVYEDWCYGQAYSPEIVVTKEPGQPISELTVSGLIEPVIGQKPEDTVSLGEYAIIYDCRWQVYDENTESWEDMDYEESAYTDSFEKGKKYMYLLQGFSKAGYEFAPNIRVLYNGVELPDFDENIETRYSSKIITEDRHCLAIILYFENVKDKTILQELTLTGPSKPVAGEMPKDDVSLGDNVDISDNNWEVYDGSWMDMSKNELDGTYLYPFEEGKMYMYYLTARAKCGYEFASDIKVFYNGKEIPDWDMDEEYSTFKFVEDDGSIYIEIGPEDITGSVVVVSVDEENAPTNVYNLQGILVKCNATTEDLRSLPVGIYIIRGKKVIMK